jgi:hypothetical protein
MDVALEGKQTRRLPQPGFLETKSKKEEILRGINIEGSSWRAETWSFEANYLAVPPSLFPWQRPCLKRVTISSRRIAAGKFEALKGVGSGADERYAFGCQFVFQGRGQGLWSVIILEAVPWVGRRPRDIPKFEPGVSRVWSRWCQSRGMALCVRAR